MSKQRGVTFALSDDESDHEGLAGGIELSAEAQATLAQVFDPGLAPGHADALWTLWLDQWARDKEAVTDKG